MLKEQSDINKFNSLMCSLEIWGKATHNHVTHEEFGKDSGSLYRYGWFIINGYRYSISGWKIREGIVTFEREDTGEKVKFDIMLSRTVSNEFQRDSFITKITKKIRILLSVWLRKLSDKLQP